VIDMFSNVERLEIKMPIQDVNPAERIIPSNRIQRLEIKYPPQVTLDQLKYLLKGFPCLRHLQMRVSQPQLSGHEDRPFEVSCGQSLESLDLNLRDLIVKHVYQRSKALNCITNVLNNLPNLKRLRLRNVSSVDAQSERNLLDAINRLSKLESLTLDYLAFIYSLEEFKPIMKTLKHLDIDPVEAGNEDIQHLLVSSTNLRYLRLVIKRPRGSKETIIDILQHHKARNPDFVFILYMNGYRV